MAAFLAVMCFICIPVQVYAALPGEGKTILYVPIDTRPITSRMSWEVAAKLGYEIVTPPETLLGNWQRSGDPDGLWDWLGKNAAGARAAVISSDAMLYGSLVHSRRHSFSEAEVMERVSRFQTLRKEYPRLPLYVYGTIMRTPKSASNSNGFDAEIIQQYGASLHRYTSLKDKEELGELSRKERKELSQLKEEIPSDALEGWMARRRINYKANTGLIDLVRENQFSFLLLAGDDGALRSQTHFEGRHLREYGKDVWKTRFQVMSGADELGMLMLCRAVNDDVREIPFLYVAYNEGKGADTIPAYSNEPIGRDIDSAILCAGGIQVPSPEKADLVIAVNSDPNGKTAEASSEKNGIRPGKGTKPFMDLVRDLVGKGYPVGIGDITYANGSDNALMEQLRRENLQFAIRAYSGWNTATNSTGFLIGAGLLTKWMEPIDVQELLITRYLDEWVYQANVRQDASARFVPNGTAEEMAKANRGVTELVAEFARRNINLPAGCSLENLRVTLPWHRFFECDPEF